MSSIGSTFCALFCIMLHFGMHSSLEIYKDNNVHSSLLYNESDALSALYYAYAAYCGRDELIDWSCKVCQETDAFKVANGGDGVITNQQLQSYVGYDSDQKRIVLAFRGTVPVNIENWITDFDALRRVFPYANGTVHVGFYNAYHTLLDNGLKAQLQSVFTQHPGSHMLVTGHSLGGAMAHVAALEFKSNTETWSAYHIGRTEVVTFGSPRVFNKQLAGHFNSVVDSNLRIAFKRDIVPTLPYVAMGYYHSAPVIYYKDLATVLQCEETGEDKVCKYLGFSLVDHLNYLGVWRHSACEVEAPTTTFNGDADSDSIWSGWYEDGIWFDVDNARDETLQNTVPISVTDADIQAELWDDDHDDDDVVDGEIEDGDFHSFTTSEMREEESDTTPVKEITQKIVYKVKKEFNKIPKTMLIVVGTVGWLTAIVMTVCACQAKKQYNALQGQSTYVQMMSDKRPNINDS